MLTRNASTGSTGGTPFEQAPRGRSSLYRAWISLALVPGAFFLAFAAATGIYALTGHDPSTGATTPLWADVAAGLPALLILLAPCVGGLFYGRRAVREGAPAGRVPEVLGALLALGAVALVVLGSA